MRQGLSSKIRTFKGATVEKNGSVGVASVCPIYPPQYIDPPFRSGNQVRLFMSPVRGDFRGRSSALSSPSSNNASKYQIDPEPQPHPPLPPATHLSLRWKGTNKASDPPPLPPIPPPHPPLPPPRKEESRWVPWWREGRFNCYSIPLHPSCEPYTQTGSSLCTEMDSYNNDGIWQVHRRFTEILWLHKSPRRTKPGFG